MYTCTTMQERENRRRSPAASRRTRPPAGTPRAGSGRRTRSDSTARPAVSPGPAPAQSCCPQLADLLDHRLFRALADGNRLVLLMRLAACGRACTVSELNACCPVDLSVVSRHLGILRDAGALEATRCGKEVFYRVRFERLVPLLRGIAAALDSCRCAAESCAAGRAALPAPACATRTQRARRAPVRIHSTSARKERSS